MNREHNKDGAEERLLRRLMPALVACTSFLAFLPTRTGEFLDWDDRFLLIENRSWQGLGWENLHWMFSTTYNGVYQPLNWLTYALDYRFWSLNPAAYHLTNMLLHALCSAVFYFMALRLLRLAKSGMTPYDAFFAGLAALYFGVHPLRVECVGWISERCDILAGIFCFLAVLFYLKAHDIGANERPRTWGVLSVAAYALSLLCKGSAIMLPFLLTALDVYPLRRREDLALRFREKIPYFLLLASISLITIGGRAQRSLLAFGPVQRLAQAGFGLAFPLWKTIIPLKLAPLYELPYQLNPWDRPFVLSAIAVLGISLLAFSLRRRLPSIIATWSCHIIMLLPMLGFISYGNQLFADRYTYISCAGWPILLAGMLMTRSARAAVAATVLVLALASLSWRQSRIWRDSMSLWAYEVSVRPQTALAQGNLAANLAQRGAYEEAFVHFREALRLLPSLPATHDNFCKALTAKAMELANAGNNKEAAKLFFQAVGAAPWNASAYNNLGVILQRLGRYGEAMGAYAGALRLQPDFPLASENLRGLRASLAAGMR